MTEHENHDETMKDGDNGDSPSAQLLSLHRRLVYQNPKTGTVSSTSLAVRQLCRMFSPPSSTTSQFTADTQLLALQEDGVTYDEEGWKPARDVPVLKHAALNAFYYTQKGASQGPVSCRQLSAVRYQAEGALDPEKDQVYGESTGNQWTLLKSVPGLEVALEAFRDQPTTSASSAAKAASNAQDYDVSVMIYEDDNDKPATTEEDKKENEKDVQDELEAFLSSTDHMGPKGMPGAASGAGEDDDEGYESDGGTKYVKDPRTGNWIHHSLAPPRKDPAKPPPNKKAKIQNDKNNNNNNAPGQHQPKRKKKGNKFAAKNAKCWIYITGLPADTKEEELAKFFSKVGIIDLDPQNQRPKVKLYKHKEGPQKGTCKGDASICYARAESVALALQVLDEAPFRDSLKGDNYPVRVQRAKFEQQGGDYHARRQRVSEAQRKVAKMAVKQARDWDDGEFNGRLTGGLKGLRIIVLKRLFHPEEFARKTEEEEDALLAELERDVRQPCEELGAVEKITVFSKNPRGVLIVKFAQPGAASEAVKAWNGKSFTFNKKDRKVEATFWDGVQDYTIRDEANEEAEMEKRHDAFGDWLDGQGEDELPEELRLKVEQ